jgi:hypothetical protein
MLGARATPARGSACQAAPAGAPRAPAAPLRPGPPARAPRAAPPRAADEGAAAASRRRLQRQLGDDERAREPEAGPVIDVAAEEYSDGPAERVVIPPPRPAGPRPAAGPPPQLPQGWPDDAPPSVTASLALVPKKGAGGALGRHRSDDPITGFFVKCRLAWQVGGGGAWRAWGQGLRGHGRGGD